MLREMFRSHRKDDVEGVVDSRLVADANSVILFRVKSASISEGSRKAHLNVDYYVISGVNSSAFREDVKIGRSARDRAVYEYLSDSIGKLRVAEIREKDGVLIPSHPVASLFSAQADVARRVLGWSNEVHHARGISDFKQ